MFKEELVSMLLKMFHKTESEGTLPNSLYEAKRQTKDTSKKENYRLISLMNFEAKVINIIMAKRIQQEIRKIIHHEQIGLSPRMQWMVQQIYKLIQHINRSKDKNH
jgi:hypothetical protein